MDSVERDEQREDRITMEAVVDCYGPEEQAIGWYYYLADRLAFPFTAHCVEERAASPLREGDEVEVAGMAPEDDCPCEMLVMVAWSGRSFGVPLAQLEAVGADAGTDEALGDWHYWVRRGYRLC